MLNNLDLEEIKKELHEMVLTFPRVWEVHEQEQGENTIISLVLDEKILPLHLGISNKTSEIRNLRMLGNWIRLSRKRIGDLCSILEHNSKVKKRPRRIKKDLSHLSLLFHGFEDVRTHITCTKCKEKKPISEFNDVSRTHPATGKEYRSKKAVCISCEKEISKYYSERRKKRKENFIEV